MRPLGSTSSSARYGAPPFVRSCRFALTAKTPSTTRSSARSEITAAESIAATVASGRARDLAVSRAPLRRGGRRAARRPGRAALRRDRRRRRVRATCAREPVQHRPPDAARLAGGRRRDARRLARARRAAARRSPRSGGSRRSSPAPTASSARARASSASIEATPYSERQGAAARAHARRARRRAACGCCARRAPSSSRSSCSTTPTRPSSGPRGEPGHGRRGGRRAHAASGGCRPDELEIDVPLLIADGHHRYETAVAFREEDPAADAHLRRARLVALARARDLPDAPRSRGRSTPSRTGSMTSSWDTVVARALPRAASFFRLDTHDDELDARRSSASSREGVELHAVRRARRSPRSTTARPSAAFLVRAPTVAQVAEFAARGETMPQKSTYFFPKLTSGLPPAPSRPCRSTRLRRRPGSSSAARRSPT